MKTRLLLMVFGVLSLFSVSAKVHGAALMCEAPSCVEHSGSNAVLSNDGTHIAVYDWGAMHPERTPILFLHGFPHNGNLWLSQVHSGLRNRYRIITMDARGSGASDKPPPGLAYTHANYANDVQAVINQLNLKGVIIVGHSYGGHPLIDYALIDNGISSGKIKGLAFVAATVDPNSDAQIPPSTFNLILNGICFSYNFVCPPGVFESATADFLKVSTYRPLSKGNFNFLLSQDLQTTLPARIGLLTTPAIPIPPADSSGKITDSQWARINVPVLIIHGAQDQVVLVPGSDFLNSKLVNASPKVYLIYPNVGHLSMIENKVQFNSDLDSFIMNIPGTVRGDGIDDTGDD